MQRIPFTLTPLCLFALILSGCESLGGGVEPTAPVAGARVTEAAGVVVLYLCDQAKMSALAWSDTQADYYAKVEEIRALCIPVADAYETARTARLAALSAKRRVGECQSKGAACTTEVAALAVKAAEALQAEQHAVGQAQQALVQLQVVQ